MATYQELRARSQQVRDEQNIGGNTALRVGQLLMDIVKYFNDNDAAASEYLQQHFAMVNDGTHLLNWQQSPIVILHTMGETYDEGDFSSLSQGENYYRNGFIVEANGQGGGINGETPKVNVLYVNLANDTLYTWNGASFDAITSGGGGSISGDDILKNAYYLNGNLVLVFDTENGDKTVSIPVNFDASNYVPTSRTVNGKALSSNITLSQSDIPGLVAALAGKISGIKTSDNTPLTPDSNGIVTLPPAGSTISPATAAPSMDGTASVGISDKYAREDHVHPHDSTKLSKSDVSVETQGDGTVDINVGSGANKDTYKINLNHTHEHMAKLVICEESDLPSTLAMDTIYAQVDNDTNPSEIQKLWIAGLEFAGGGAAPGTPRITSPTNGRTFDLGETVNGSASTTITIKARDITQPLVVEFGNGSTGFSFDTSDLPTGVSYDSGTGKLTITVEAATSINGVDIDIVYSGNDYEASGTLGISSSEVSIECGLLASNQELPSGYQLCEYIENTDNNSPTSPYILTGVYPSSEFRVVGKVQNSAPSGYKFLYGSHETTSSKRFECSAYNTFVQGFVTTGSSYGTAYRTTSNGPHIFDHNKNRIIYDGVEYPSSSDETWTSTYEFVVCGLNNGGTEFGSGPVAKYYYFKIYSGDTLVRHFIPAYKTSSSKYGFYDLVNGVFYSSARSGHEFTGLIKS